MKNGFVTDVLYFRFNRKIQQKQHSVFTVTIFIFTILITILPIVYSLPNNEIKLPKDVRNDLKNGLVKADNSISNEFIHGNISHNYDSEFKHVHRRKGGKHHHKKFHSRKHNIKIEHKAENEANINDSNHKYKYVEQSANKFDYYPIEPVNMKYDPKEDEKIRFVLITGNDVEKKKKTRRHKRDVTAIEENESIKLKRELQSPSGALTNKDYYSQYSPNNPWNNRYNRYDLPSAGVRFAKIAIPGLYYNAITPYKIRPNVPDSILNRLDLDIGPVWDRRPIKQAPSNSISVTTAKPYRTTVADDNEEPLGIGVAPSPAAPSNGPSSCIWAIVNCCSKSDLTIRYGCFEDIGCVGAFWDFNPCGDSWQQKAVEEAEKFFEEDDF